MTASSGVKAQAVREAVVQAKHEIVDHEPVLVVPQIVDLPKSDRVVKEKQRPLFFDMPDSPLPAARTPRRCSVGAGDRQRRKRSNSRRA